jgi:molybdenum-dependent DNA-binding transcriptional regulator ModE
VVEGEDINTSPLIRVEHVARPDGASVNSFGESLEDITVLHPTGDSQPRLPAPDSSSDPTPPDPRQTLDRAPPPLSASGEQETIGAPSTITADSGPVDGDVLGRVGGVDLGVLRAVVRVSEVGSITGAAARLGCSQPGLSQRVKTAEQALGARLFDRTHQGVTPTAFAARILPSARMLLVVGEAMAQEVARAQDHAGGERP